MATQTLPHVVPFPQSVPAVKAITQTEVELLLSLRGRLKQLQEQVSAEEESLKARLESGAVVEPGDHAVSLKESFRRNVSWKAIVIRLAVRLKMDGTAYCDRILAATKPTRTVSLDID
ncbi:MAG: hypothetical protein WCA91_13300 [Candidatus Acidiferrales bacterium]